MESLITHFPTSLLCAMTRNEGSYLAIKQGRKQIYPNLIILQSHAGKTVKYVVTVMLSRVERSNLTAWGIARGTGILPVILMDRRDVSRNIDSSQLQPAA